jgi:adenylate cyclase
VQDCPQGVLFRGQPEVEEETEELDDDGNPKLKRRKADDEHLIRKALLELRLIDAINAHPRHRGGVRGETHPDATTCAVAWQVHIAEHQAEGAEDNRLQFRIGINLGDVIVEGNDIHGDGVNVASRLEKLAEPGGLCIARNVFELVEAKLGIAFTDQGEHEVKNIAKPVRVYRAELTSAPGSTGSAMTKTANSSQTEKVSIAVLPFTNMSGDKEQEYFSDGITEDIITEMSRFRELRVTARNSSFSFRGKNIDLSEIARKLRVQFVVEGSIRKAGNRLRITCRAQ